MTATPALLHTGGGHGFDYSPLVHFPEDPHVVCSRPSTFGDELAISINHGLRVLLAIVGLPILMVNAVHVGSTAAMVGAAVYGSSAFLMYMASTLYHAVSHERVKTWLQRLDYGAIYLLIAGTYTPIALGVLRGGWGSGPARRDLEPGAAGTDVQAAGRRAVRATFHGPVVAMGWMALIAIPLWLRMPEAGLILLFGGGLAYTLAVVFFMLHERLRYSHFIWHLFVLSGTG